MGRIETIGNATLYLGDCREILPTLGKVDAVVTDPPYGMNRRVGNHAITPKQKDGHIWGQSWNPIVGDREEFDPSPWLAFDNVVLWGANHFCSTLPSHHNWLVWFKGVPEASDYSDCELAWTSKRTGGVRSKHILWSGFRRETEIREHHHPAQKPVALMEWCMRQIKLVVSSVILDPYMGSGSTGIAAYNQNHRFIGIECDKTHFDTARKRISAAHQQSRLPFNGPSIAIEQPDDATKAGTT